MARFTQTGGSGSGGPGPRGPQGPAGDSAYDIAVENGFVGTEQEWLESIGGNADIADFTFTYDSEETDSIITIHNHDMRIETTRDGGQDADIEINSADDIWINANDEIAIVAQNDDIRITSATDPVYITAGGGETWTFRTDGGLRFPDDTVQTTAYTGPIDTISNGLVVTGQIDDPSINPAGTMSLSVQDGYTALMDVVALSATFNGDVQITNFGPEGDGTGQRVFTVETPTTINNDLTVNKIITTSNNGQADNIMVGDDAFIGDTNIANHIAIIGNQDSTTGGIVLGNGTTERLSSDGSNLSVTAENDIVLNPGSTYAYIGTPLLDGSNRIAKMSDIQGGGPDSHGNFVFDNSTLSVDNETTYIKATDGGDDSVEFMMNPYDGIAKISAKSGTQTPRFYASNPDWESATWTTIGEGQGQISFVNAPGIVNMLSGELNTASNVGIYVNNMTIGSWNGASFSGFDVNIFVYGPNAENTTEASVDVFGFNYSFESKIEINNSENSMDITARDLTLNIRATEDRDINIIASDDATLRAEGDDLFLQAADDIRFTANYSDGEGEHLWRMDSEGEFHLPGNGLIWNPSNSSGDGYGADTIHLVPNDTENETEQRIIIDPTGPNHIHIRAGGLQDYSTADLILGGERAGVRVSDTEGTTVIQSKQEDYIWTYQNVGQGDQIYVIASAMAEPDINDFTIISGQKFVITNVVRDEQNGTTSYETTPGIGFVPFENYTFIRDRGNHVWNFDRAGYLNGPTETGSLRVTGIMNDDGNLDVQADQNLILSGGESNGEYLHDSSNPNNQIATIGDVESQLNYWNGVGVAENPAQSGFLILDGITRSDSSPLLVSASGAVLINGTDGEFLNDVSVPSNQIATIGDITTAVGVGGNGEVTRWSPNFTATGLTFTGTDTTYPTYNSHYVKNGRMVSFWIAIDLSTVTNFGTGQYITALPYAPLTGTMNHFQAWANVDPAVNPDIAGHVVLQADHLANTTALDLHYLKQAGGANSPLMEAMFTQDAPATLTTSSKIYINGTYITAE